MASDFVGAVAEATGTDPSNVEAVIDASLTLIQRTLAEGGEVTFPGFGKFSTTTRAARTGRNPRTGASMAIPATTYAKFTAGTGLRAAVKDGTPLTSTRSAAPRKSPIVAATSTPEAPTAPKTSKKTKKVAEKTKKKAKKDKKK